MIRSWNKFNESIEPKLLRHYVDLLQELGCEVINTSESNTLILAVKEFSPRHTHSPIRQIRNVKTGIIFKVNEELFALYLYNGNARRRGWYYGPCHHVRTVNDRPQYEALEDQEWLRNDTELKKFLKHKLSVKEGKIVADGRGWDKITRELEERFNESGLETEVIKIGGINCVEAYVNGENGRQLLISGELAFYDESGEPISSALRLEVYESKPHKAVMLSLPKYCQNGYNVDGVIKFIKQELNTEKAFEANLDCSYKGKTAIMRELEERLNQFGLETEVKSTTSGNTAMYADIDNDENFTTGFRIYAERHENELVFTLYLLRNGGTVYQPLPFAERIDVEKLAKYINSLKKEIVKESHNIPLLDENDQREIEEKLNQFGIEVTTSKLHNTPPKWNQYVTDKSDWCRIDIYLADPGLDLIVTIDSSRIRHYKLKPHNRGRSIIKTTDFLNAVKAIQEYSANLRSATFDYTIEPKQVFEEVVNRLKEIGLGIKMGEHIVDGFCIEMLNGLEVLGYRTDDRDKPMPKYKITLMKPKQESEILTSQNLDVILQKIKEEHGIRESVGQIKDVKHVIKRTKDINRDWADVNREVEEFLNEEGVETFGKSSANTLILPFYYDVLMHDVDGQIEFQIMNDLGNSQKLADNTFRTKDLKVIALTCKRIF